MSTYDNVVSDMHERGRRIKTLEKQVAEMTARAEEAEAQVAALREAVSDTKALYLSKAEPMWPDTNMKAKMDAEDVLHKRITRALEDTAAAAEAYEKRIRAKVLREVHKLILTELFKPNFSTFDTLRFIGITVAKQLAALEAEQREGVEG